MTCRACEASADRFEGQKNGFALFRCACGSLNARVETTDLPTYTDFYATAAFEDPPGVFQSQSAVVESVESYRRSGTWLDIGYGEGGLLKAAALRNWKCSGAEISRAALDFGRAQAWDVGDDTTRWADGFFDVVSAMEIVEHVIAPRELVREAARLLRPGGALVMTTPNAASITYRVRGLNWSVVAPPEHVTLFSPWALVGLVRNAGFLNTSLRTTGLNPSEIMKGPRGVSTAASRNAGAQKWVSATSKGQSGRLAKRVANAVLNLVQCGDSLKLIATKPSGKAA